MAEEKKAKSSAARNVLLAIFVIAAAGLVWMQLQKGARIRQENDAIASLNDGKYQEALSKFEELYESANAKAQPRLASNIARCYVGMAEESNLAITELLNTYYRKAAQYDKSVITDPVILKAYDAMLAKEETAAMSEGATEPAEAPAPPTE
jgi:hypothetical protein